MIRNATLTILGLWQYDKTILDGLQMPQGISKETVRDNLLMECAELEVVYPDPDFMKQAVNSWSAMMFPVWQELYETTQYEYNPIWNKDGTITETITRGLETTGTKRRDLDTTDSGSINSTNEELHQTKGYNSTSWADSTKDTGTASSTTSATGSEDETTNESGTEDETTTLSRTEKGNIGVTTTQRMIQEQREVVEFNIMRRIIDDFKMRFCILVY